VQVARVLSLATPRPYADIRAHLGIRPVRALQVAIACIVVGNLGRIPFLDLGDRSAPILINDLCIAGLFVVGGLAMLNARSLRLNDVAVAGLVFASIGALSALAGVQRFGFSALELIGSLAYLLRWTLYFSIYVVVINCVRARDSEAVWKTLEWAMIAIVAFGIVQSIFLPNFAFIVYPDAREGMDWDAQRNRLVSTLLEPNLVAGMIGTILLVQLARLSTGVRTPLWKPILMFGGLVLTLSRGGLVSFILGGLLLLAVRGVRKPVLRFAAVLFVLLLAASPKLIEFASEYSRFRIDDPSAMTRVVVWQRALATFLDYPIFGIGFNTYGFVQERRGFERLGTSSYSAEGGLLFVAVLTGIVGLIVFLAMLWFVLRRCRRGWRHPLASNTERGLLVGTGAATVAILANSVFTNTLLTPWSLEPVLVLWGLAFVIASDLRRRQAEHGAP
jgi:O-antigen ligase